MSPRYPCAERMRSRLFRHRSSGRVNAPRAPGPTAHVTLRLAAGDDDEALARLAALYDRVGCVNRISLQTGQIRTADEFTHPTRFALS
jgi:predicted dinucleotide-binding enzyme